MYIFVLFVGTVLVILNYKAAVKDQKSFKNIMNDKSESLSDAMIEVGKLRKEFAETIFELQSEIEDLRFLLNENESSKIIVNVEEKINDNKIDLTFNDEFDMSLSREGLIDEDEETVSSRNQNFEEKKEDNINKTSIKYDEIGRLISEGYSIEEISEFLKMGKGEVLLIKELYLK
jgi:hypothetical protein